MDLQEQLLRQINDAERRLTKIQSIKKQSADVTGRIVNHGGKNKYFLLYPEDVVSNSSDTAQYRHSKRPQYISYKDSEKIQSLANKKYSTALYEHYAALLKDLKLAYKRAAQISKLHIEYETRYPIDLEGSLVSNKSLAEKWAVKKYKSNPIAIEDADAVRTRKGEVVRSRAEAIIANWLYDNKIPYRYESPLFLKNRQKEIYPDFTVMNPDTLEPVYIEYFGLMSKEDYATNAIRKIDDYAVNGITLGKNFIPFFEFYEQINTATISRTLEEFFK